MLKFRPSDEHNRTLVVSGVDLTGFNGATSDEMKVQIGYQSGWPADEFADGALAVELDGKVIPTILAATEAQQALYQLADVADRVRADITDQDTGWYYQFQAAVQKAQRALRTIADAT